MTKTLTLEFFRHNNFSPKFLSDDGDYFQNFRPKNYLTFCETKSFRFFAALVTSFSTAFSLSGIPSVYRLSQAACFFSTTFSVAHLSVGTNLRFIAFSLFRFAYRLSLVCDKITFMDTV